MTGKNRKSIIFKSELCIYLDPISGFPGYRSMLCKVTPSNAERKEA